MPPKSKAKVSSASTSKCRRSRRIAYKIKSMVKGKSVTSKKQPSSTKVRKLPNSKKPLEETQTASSKEQSSSTKVRKLPNHKKPEEKTQPTSSKQQSSTKKKQPNRKKPVDKTQPASSNEQSSSTIKNGKPSYNRKNATKRQSASSDEEQSISTKNSTVKKTRVMEMDEINERASQMRHQELEDFSTNIKKIQEELSPDLDIEEEAITEMNMYLNHIFHRLARTSAILLIGRGDVCMTETDIEAATLQVVEGEIAKYCVAEGRRGVKNGTKKDM